MIKQKTIRDLTQGKLSSKALTETSEEDKSTENAYWERVFNPRPQHILNSFGLNDFINHRLNDIGIWIELDEFNREIYLQLVKYFSNDIDFNGDLKKGMLIRGPLGCGKTFLMKAFRLNQKASFKVVSCKDLCREFAERGFEVITEYSKPQRIITNVFGQDQIGVCFDDLGTDEGRKYYGDSVNVMVDIITKRYETGLAHMTFITTNLTGDQVSELYGDRIRSRMREMFNTLNFDVRAKDRRK